MNLTKSKNNKAELDLIHLCFQTNGYFRYIDGWRMTFTRWGEDEPSMDRPCVYMDLDGKWKTAYCNQTIKSVCMKSTGMKKTGTFSFKYTDVKLMLIQAITL